MRASALIFCLLSASAITCAPLATPDSDDINVQNVAAGLPSALAVGVLTYDASPTQPATSGEPDEPDEPDETHGPSATPKPPKNLSVAAEAGIAIAICLPFFLLIGVVAACVIRRGRHKRVSLIGPSTIGVGAGWIIFRGNHANTRSGLESASECADKTAPHPEDPDSEDEQTGFLRAPSRPVSMLSMAGVEAFELDSGWRGRTPDGEDIWSPR